MLSEVNTAVFHFLNSFTHYSGVTDTLFYILSNGAGIALLISTATIVAMREWKKKRFAPVLFHIFIPVAIAVLYSQVLKDLIGAPRPELVLNDIATLFDHGGMDSFPSGHATVYGALAASVYFYSKRFGIALGVGTIVIGVARVIAGVHWPADIVAGLLAGVLISYAYHHFFTQKKQFFEKN